MHTEIKVDGVWHHYSQPRIQRLYGLFAMLAGVRNRLEWAITPVAPVRGIPADATFTTLLDYEWWVPNAHDASWVTGEELSRVVRDFEALYRKQECMESFFEHKQLGYLFSNDWATVPDLGSRKFEGVRAVFWFDN